MFFDSGKLQVAFCLTNLLPGQWICQSFVRNLSSRPPYCQCTVSGWHTCFNVIAVLNNILKLHRMQTVYTLQVLTLIHFLKD